jgi:hypothetical protein
MTSTWIDYTETRADIAIEGEENYPSSFARECNERVKYRFPCLRSYMFRRRLSCVAATSIFIVAGVLASLYMNVFDFGKFPTSGNLFGSSTNCGEVLFWSRTFYATKILLTVTSRYFDVSNVVATSHEKSLAEQSFGLVNNVYRIIIWA